MTILCAGTTCGAAAYLAPPTGTSAPQSALLVASRAPALPETDDPLQAPRLEIDPNARDLSLAGDLIEGIADRVADLLAAHPHVERLHLTSEGGLVEEALALGALVAAHALATYVPKTCASACTLVFVRGRGRFLAEGGRLGFHGPYEVGFFEAIRQVDAAPERTAYLNAGLAPDFVAQALVVRAEAMWMPVASRLRAAGVVTEMVARYRFPEPRPQVESAEGNHRVAGRPGPDLVRQGEQFLLNLAPG